MLKISHLKAGYNGMTIVHDACMTVERGTIVALIGSNGSGKTTLLRAVTGDIPVMAGEVIYEGDTIVGEKSHNLVKKGICMVPEGRHLFGKLSVKDNLLMGAYLTRDKAIITRRMEEIYELLPVVKERSKQLANTLSGGEQQMVAIARGLMTNPRLIILDEPSLGLMPKLISEIFVFIQTLAESGRTVIIVEQNATAALEMADYAYVMQNGETVLEGTGMDLLNDESVRKAYLGG